MLSFFVLSLLVTDYIFCSSSIYRPQWSCGKVMFLQLSFSHSVHKGVCMAGGVRAMHAPFHYTCPQHVCPPAMHVPPNPTKHSPCQAQPLPCMPSAMHPPCHAHPLLHMPPAMHTTCHACPLPCMPPHHTCPLAMLAHVIHAPTPSNTPHLPYTHPLPCMPPLPCTPPWYGQWAGSMHPTGMHPCSLISSFKVYLD